jgi:hypothetical protein
VSDSDRAPRAAAPKPPAAPEYRFGSRDLGVCAAVLLLFALPLATRSLCDALIAAQVMAGALGPVKGLGLVIIPPAAAAYFIARQRMAWGWKLAACCGALVAWAILCKALLTGEMISIPDLSFARAPVAVAAALIALGSFRWGRDRHLPFVAAAIFALSLFIALRQLWLGPLIGDIYLYQQGLWNTIHGGQLFFVSDEGGSHFGTHFSPALFALLPIYALWPSPVPLLITQSAALAATAFPVHGLVRRHWPEGEALALSAGFLLLPPVLGPTLWLFHEASYGLAAFLAALLYFERRRAVPFAVFAALSLMVKETFIIPAALFSFYAALRRRGGRWIALPAVGVAIYAAVVFGLIMPHFRTDESGRPFRYLYGYLGDSPGAAAQYLANHPQRTARLLSRGRNRIYLEQVAAPYGYLFPLGSWPVVFGAPDAVAVLLARPSPWPVRDPTAHYSMLVAAALFVAFAYSAAALTRRLRSSRTPAALVAALFFIAAAAGGLQTVARYSRLLPPDAVNARRRLTAMIPRQASVVTTWAAASYLANRREIYIERDGRLNRLRPDYYLGFHRPDTAAAQAEITALGYRLVGSRGGFELWRRDTGAPGR